MKYLIVGYGGNKNKGCEALLKTTVSQIRKNDLTAIITVAVFEYDYEIKHKIKGVDKYIRHNHLEHLTQKEQEVYNQFKINNNIDKIVELQQKEVLSETSDYCLSIGGDNYSAGYVQYLNIININQKKKGSKLILWGCSLYENIEDDKLIEDLKLFDIIIARESLSYKELLKFISKERLLLLPDPAFSLKMDNLLDCKKYGEYICLNLSDIIVKGNSNAINIINKFIDYLLKTYKFNIILLPHVYTDIWNDYITLKIIKENFKNENRILLLDEKEEYSCIELKKIIAYSKGLITARTHASIAGYSTGVPTLVLGYSLKSKGLANDLFGNTKDYVISYDYLTYELLVEKFNLLMNNSNLITELLNKKMKNYIYKSKRLLTNAIILMEQNTRKHVCDNCMGCTACYSICPVNAIRMKLNNEGFVQSTIDLKKCINCGKCKKVCPQLNPKKSKYIPTAYSFVNIDNNILLNSSSGGFFYDISKKVLKNKGIVYGVTMHNATAIHISITKINDINKIMGSKYVESNLNNCFKSIKNELINKKLVLFSGTPCQIAGLKSYLGKDYDKLITLSVICHGTPSQLVFNNYVNSMISPNEKIERINFRDKSTSWENYGIKIETDRNIYYKAMNCDSFMKGFLSNKYLKENCYKCQYHIYDQNIADIIMGDFWGVKNCYPNLYNKNGVSVVIANTLRGEKFLSINYPNLNKVNIKKVEKYNRCLVDSVKTNIVERTKFYRGYSKNQDLNFLNSINCDIINNDENQNFKLISEIQNLNNVIKSQNQEMENILLSKSWRITKPLRKISTIIRGKK